MHDTMHFMIGNGSKPVCIEHLHEVGSGVAEGSEMWLCASGRVKRNCSL